MMRYAEIMTEIKERKNHKRMCQGAAVRLIAASVIAVVLSLAQAGPLPVTAWAATDSSDVTEADLEMTGLRWNESSGTARWDKNAYAYKYEVKLYRGSSCKATKTTKETYYEFGNYFTTSGDYHFEVRGVGQNSVVGEWVSSDLWYVSSSEARDIRDDYDDDDDDYSSGTADVNHGPGVTGTYSYSYSYGPGGASSSTSTSGVVEQGVGVVTYGSSTVGAATYGGNHWCQDGYGWWYQYADGTYPKNCWQCIDGKYYCFNSDGYRRYGWIYWDNKWYYCGEDGALLGDTYTPDGYYVGSDGVWVQ
ncbi:MAG: hypothetical protein LUD07_00390 [Clostridiales bacterium]|nr:hypothetical protein [Clostridiales bacterium]